MSTSGTVEATGGFFESAGACQAVVLYENAAAQGNATDLCHRLVTQLGSELDFAFQSCEFRHLADPVIAHRTAEAAAVADILLVATHGNDLPPTVCSWLQTCGTLRTTTEGALVLLFVEPISPSAMIGELLARMEAAARRLRMDFLPLVPLPARPLVQVLAERARPLSPLLREMFNRPPSDHWGLNE